MSENTGFNVGRLFALLTQQEEFTDDDINDIKGIIGEIQDPEEDAGDMDGFRRGVAYQQREKATGKTNLGLLIDRLPDATEGKEADERVWELLKAVNYLERYPDAIGVKTAKLHTVAAHPFATGIGFLEEHYVADVVFKDGVKRLWLTFEETEDGLYFGSYGSEGLYRESIDKRSLN